MRYGSPIAAILLLFPLPAAAQPKSITMPALTMTGLGAPPASAANVLPPLKTIAMPPLTMTGLGAPSASGAAQPMQLRRVTMPALTMTGLGSPAAANPGAKPAPTPPKR